MRQFTKHLIVLVFLFGIVSVTSCGKVDLDIPETTQTIKHEIVFDGSLEMFNDICTTKHPDDTELQQACVDGYMQSLAALLDTGNKKNTSTLVL